MSQGNSHKMMGHPRLLSGWGRTSPSASQCNGTPKCRHGLCSFDLEWPWHTLPGDPFVPVETIRELKNSVIARGLGRSYGDAAQCAGGTVVDTSGFDSVGVIDPVTGWVEVGGGTSLDALIRASSPWAGLSRSLRELDR